ncbi:MAG: hypothetical protein HND48_25615 [Chloroflexi bacterium]|nr:hypothetical protein [Chloroflexota bacterium]
MAGGGALAGRWAFNDYLADGAFDLIKAGCRARRRIERVSQDRHVGRHVRPAGRAAHQPRHGNLSSCQCAVGRRRAELDDL